VRLRSLWAISVLVSMFIVAGCQNNERDSHAESSQTRLAAAPPVDSRDTVDVAPPEAPAGRKPAGQEVPQLIPLGQKPADELLAPVPSTRQPQEMTLISMPVSEAPTIDGHASEAFWDTAPAITTLDYSSQRPITLKSVYTTDRAFFLVTFPDETPSETHKAWRWDAKEEIYREGPEREDVFVFKWSMSGNNVNMALRDHEIHHADIWFWKARRTNAAGYADDKWQSLTLEPGLNARKLDSKHGTLYFRRQGDTGEPAFEEKFFFEYQGDVLEKYALRHPEGSRADVSAKGVWSAGQWTIELGRQLDTLHEDDVAFAPGGVYLFGVSCYAMAYDTPHNIWSQPLYRTGDVFDRLFFTLAPRNRT
jgi:hypothetical protein